MNLNKTICSLAMVAAIFFAAAPVHAVTIFLSEDAPGSGATLSNPTIVARPGDMITLHVYVDPDPGDAPFDTIAINADASTAGIVSPTGFDVITPDILVGAIDIGDRWDGTGGTLGAPGGLSLVDNMNGVAVTETGLDGDNDGSGAFLDGGYDASAGAFHFGSISLSAAAEGSTDIFLSTGMTKIVREGDTPAMPAMVMFGAMDTLVSGGTTGATGGIADATISVIPEPNAALLLLLAALSLGVCYRRGIQKGTKP